MPEIKQATLLFLKDKDRVLLAMKKRGFGVGRYNGVGGKKELGEGIDAAALRECQEEISVTPIDFSKVAELDFHFPEKKTDWNQKVTVYLCTRWSGDPTESEEMKPDWFSIEDIPYEKMWSDDKYWLPAVLEGNYVKATFYFDDKDEILPDESILEVSEIG